MSTKPADTTKPDPLLVLREYRGLAPWSLRDLSVLSTAILDCSSVKPINAAATTQPNERTIRFYVGKNLVSAPQGRGTAATYNYRHLLQILFIKLRQMEGTTLGQIRTELQSETGDILERRVASALGPFVPRPVSLQFDAEGHQPSGRSGRVLGRARQRGPSSNGTAAETKASASWYRLELAPGIELSVSEGHPLYPLARDNEGLLRESLLLSLGRLSTEE
ncbi:MAG: MerR family transcriptional regulator [Gemmatimonadales bacterium]